MKKLLLILSLFIATEAFSAENKARISAKFTPDSIAIGEQFKLRVEVTKDLMQEIALPEFKNNMFNERFEILSSSPLDTIDKKDRSITLSKEYLMTVFDPGFYTTGRFPVLVASRNSLDTLFSDEQLSLMVTTYEIDTATMEIFDIVEPLDMPLKFGEFSGYLFGSLLVIAALVFLIMWLVRHFKISRKAERKQEKAHVIAIRKLESLHHQKLWQSSKHKLYYTSLTDILREYLERRYGVKAMEMTTPEIMDALRDIDLPAVSRDNLKLLLARADFVKFAKFTPEASDNETSYTWAYYFVEETKVLEQEINTKEE